MTINPLWRQVMGYWRRSGLAIKPGVSDADVAAFQQRHGVTLPVQMRALLQAADGCGRCVPDDSNMAFWSLSEIAHRSRGAE